MDTGFQPGTLAAAIEASSTAALASGALRPIVTAQAVVEDDGMQFVVRSVSSLARKGEQRAAHGEARDPFCPWESALFVADVSDTHVGLLNKFPVLERHLLIVTRAFVDQETLLDGSDFAAAARCLDDLEGLVFYNGGEAAGASQPHKHLQLVPLPLARPGPPLPVQPLIERAALAVGEVARLPGFDFAHAFCRLAERAPATLLAAYHALLRACGMRGLPHAGGARQSEPYNLLLTRGWMLLVPRRRECWEGISVNALGYAGSLFVRDAAALAAVRRAGPLAVLRVLARTDEPGGKDAP